MPEKPAYQEGLLDSHEERIGKLESNFAEVNASLAETKLSLEFLGEKIDQATQQISLKIDSGLNPIAAKLLDHIEEDKTVNSQVESLTRWVDKAKSKDIVSTKRWETLRKGVWGVALAAIGAIIKILIDLWIGH